MAKKKSFEENLTELEKIVAELETGELQLDELLKKYETGVSVSKDLNDMLAKAEEKLYILQNGEVKAEVPNDEF